MLQVAPDLLQLGLSAAALVVRGLDNRRTSPELAAYRRRCGSRLAAHWKNRSVTDHPAIREYHRVHEAYGAPGQPPAPEKLLTYVRRQRDFTRASAAVDCYNMVSARTLLSIGAHDLERTALPITLRCLTADDTFVPLGGTEVQRLPGEYAYVEPTGQVICRLEVLQGDHSKVTPESRDVVFFLQGNRCLPASTLLKGAWLLAEMIETFCGGSTELVAFFEAGPTPWATPRKPPVDADTFKRLRLQVGTFTRIGPVTGLSGLATATVRLDREVETLLPASHAPASLVGRQVLVATELHPLRVGSATYTTSVYAAHGAESAALCSIESLPDGARLQ